MVKLSQQLQEKEGVQGRISRTQRVAQKQQYQKEKKTFEELKERAKEKQEEFEGVTSLEEYEKKYQLLDPELKQFFETPATLKQQKAERIEETKIKIQERKTYADQKMAEINAKYKKKIADRQAWWLRKSSKYRSEDKNRERLLHLL